MRREAAAKRYAQAAFAVALEHDELERWGTDLEAMAALMTQAEAIALLQSNKVPEAEKASVLKEALPDIGPRAMNLARLLVDKDRVHLAAQIAEEYRVLFDEQRGIAWADVVTAIPLDGDQKRRVAARLGEVTGKQVNVDATVDPSILGGLIARIGDTLIDGSTRSRLLALKKELMGAP